MNNMNFSYTIYYSVKGAKYFCVWNMKHEFNISKENANLCTKCQI